MPKPEWGVKRVCPDCGERFYDLLKDPILCPECGAPYEVVTKDKTSSLKADLARAKKAEAKAREKLVDDEDLVDDDSAGDEALTEDDADDDDNATPALSDEDADDEPVKFDDDVLLDDDDDDDDDAIDDIGDVPVSSEET